MFLGAWSSSVTVPLRKLKAMCWGSFIHCWEVLRHLRVLDLPRNKGSVNPVKKETEKTLLIQVPLPWRINALYKKPVKKVSLLVFAGFCVTNLKPLLLENRSRFPVWFKLLLYCSWWGVVFIFVSQRTANPRAWNTNGSSMIYVICLLVMCPRWCTSWLLAWKEISLDVTVLQVVWGKLWNAEKTWWCVQVRWGGLHRGKMNPWSEQLDLSARVLLWFIRFMKGLGAFEVPAACGELAFTAFRRERRGAQGRSS